jgi:hypothetical protein
LIYLLCLLLFRRFRHTVSKGLASSNKRASSTGRLPNFAPASSLVTDHALMGALQSGGAEVVKLGVYTMSPGDYGDSAEMDELYNIKRICLHNASVSESFGEVEKEGVWNLLAQIVDSQIQQRDNTLNGWEGSAGGALGVELVSNLFRFYESLGDVQMLATMFSVLSGANYHTRLQGRPCLLPQGRDEQYDAYIRRYAELLYGWGLLSVRAEVNKHLLRIPPRLEGEYSLEEKKETGRTPGIAVVFLCPRCGREADANTNICRSCQDYAFRCSICDMAVRGLFTICDLCGHGGHVEHMKSWFSEHVECPTGCGCNCAYSISSACPPVSEGVGA